MRGSEIEIFDGKTLSGLLEDIYNNAKETRGDIKGLLAELAKKVTNASDIVNIGPIIQSLLEVEVKNEDQLTKIAMVVQRLISAEINANSSSDPSEILTEEEKEQLFTNATKQMQEAKESLKEEMSKIPKFISSGPTT